mgnify:CR=1 FL=1
MANDDFIDEDLVEAQLSRLPERKPRKNEFKPWHRPHKQYIRGKQWATDAVRLAKELDLEDRTIRYLSLPGEDLLDVRYVGKCLFESCGLRLYFYGYDKRADGKDVEFNSLEFSVKESEYIDGKSRVINDDIRSLGQVKAKTRQDLLNLRPFHIVNLDLCGSVAGSPQSVTGVSYLDAISAMLLLQSRASWNSLLFVTSRVDRQSSDKKLYARLLGIVDAACAKYRLFNQGFRDQWNVDSAIETLKSDCYATEEDRFLLGFIEWFIATAFESGIKPTLKSVKTYNTSYCGGSGSDDMASISFGLEPILPVRSDPFDIQHPSVSAATEAEKSRQVDSKSEHVPEKVKGCERVDETLSGNVGEFLRCLEETQALLNQCGYDVSGYESWVSGGIDL